MSLEHSASRQRKRARVAKPVTIVDDGVIINHPPLRPPAPPAPSKPERFLRLDEVLRRVGVKRSIWLRLEKKGLVPQSVHPMPGGRAVAWLESEIDQFIQDRIDAERKRIEAKLAELQKHQP